MLIKYEFVNGDTCVVEVDDAVGNFIVRSRTAEESSYRVQRRHTYSFNAIKYEGNGYGEVQGSHMEKDEETQFLVNALHTLTPIQRSRLLKFASGMSYHGIANEEGRNVKSVFESIEYGRKKIKKIYEDTQQNP